MGKDLLFAGTSTARVPQVCETGAPNTRGSRVLGWEKDLGSCKHRVPHPDKVRVGFLATLALALLLTPNLQAQNQQDQQNQSFTLKVNSDIVLTNIVVRDKKTGQVVKGLKQSDFTITENGKPQQITSFDFESVDEAAALNEATISGKAGNSILLGKSPVITGDALRDHRLVVLFFDITSMQPEDVERAQDAARNYINKQMQAADVVSVVSLDSSLSLDQDFTQNKQLLLNAVNSYSGDQTQGFAPGSTSTTNQVEDTTAYTADESEYNDINTDRELFAIATIAKSLNYINQKKALLYFSGGISRDGIENQASLHAAINSAVRSNMSIYSVDARGLQAISPLGDASTGSIRGNSAYNGGALQNNLDANFNSQEVMANLSSDTGGKAFFDSNDFAPAFQRMQQDMSAYYVIGFRSSDTRRDGSYRRLTIKINRSDLKLEYRPGYYAPADYKHSTKEDRERQLEDELATDLPATDVSVYLQALYFRIDDIHYSVPISILVPGSQIPFVKGGDRDKATLDVIGEVKDSVGRIIGNARDTVKLAIDQSQQVRQRNIQYSTSFTLPAGKFHLKFVVRENETGRMGSFETDINVPDLRKAPVKLSSVVLASQRIPAGKKTDNPLNNPLIRDGQEVVPNLPHVFRQNQHLYFLYEIYNPAKATTTVTDQAGVPQVRGEDLGSNSTQAQPGVPHSFAKQKGGKGKDTAATPVRVFTSIEFLNNGLKVYETPLVQATQLNVPTRDAIAFQFDVPLADLKPGLYTCQVNVIDDAGGSFTFPRMALLIREGTPATPTTPVTTTGASTSGR
ncbi:VWA domain-containing protein [Alloacidobacterium dinghuense]|uniref:VWA domain-containing protein n=2 Tax=Alloacidobacterium dinghuense TaxID=2763107 RepID=A0A7G8BQI6_9BACT|nr:VWA domain-containing protein [Alloacidobacterium dinghuense]